MSRFTFFLITSAIVALLYAPPLKADITSDLVAYYPLDGDAQDASGNGLHGTVDPLNPQYHPTYEAGYIGQAARFDGVDDYIDLADWNVTGSAMTLSAWIKPDAITNDPRIISKAEGVNQGQITWMIGIQDGGNLPMFRLRTDTANYTEITSSTIGTSPWPWLHIAATYDGSTMRLYINGVANGTGSQSNTIGNDARNIWIGGNPAIPTDRPFNGLIDEVRVYSRTLIPSEITDLVNFTAVPFSPPWTQILVIFLFLSSALWVLISKFVTD